MLSLRRRASRTSGPAAGPPAAGHGGHPTVGGEAGFTLIELMVTCVVSVIVLGIAGSGLISLGSTFSRASTAASNEQRIAAAMLRLSADLRSVHTLVTATPTTVVAEVNQASGAPVQVTWQLVTTGTTGTLTRQSGSAPAEVMLTGVANPPGTPVFSYQNAQGASLDGALAATVTNCTTLVHVVLLSTAPSAVVPYQESESVALTDQADALASQGGTTC